MEIESKDSEHQESSHPENSCVGERVEQLRDVVARHGVLEQRALRDPSHLVLVSRHFDPYGVGWHRIGWLVHLPILRQFVFGRIDFLVRLLHGLHKVGVGTGKFNGVVVLRHPVTLDFHHHEHLVLLHVAGVGGLVIPRHELDGVGLDNEVVVEGVVVCESKLQTVELLGGELVDVGRIDFVGRMG